MARVSATQAVRAAISFAKPATRSLAAFLQTPATKPSIVEQFQDASTFILSICGLGGFHFSDLPGSICCRLKLSFPLANHFMRRSTAIRASSWVQSGSTFFPWKIAKLQVFHICHSRAAKRIFGSDPILESQRMKICFVVLGAWP